MTKYSHEHNEATVATTFRMKMQQITKKIAKGKFQDIYGAKVIYEGESNEEEEEIQIEDLE